MLPGDADRDCEQRHFLDGYQRKDLSNDGLLASRRHRGSDTFCILFADDGDNQQWHQAALVKVAVVLNDYEMPKRKTIE